MKAAIEEQAKTKMEALHERIRELEAILEDQRTTIDHHMIENATLREMVKINNVGGKS